MNFPPPILFELIFFPQNLEELWDEKGKDKEAYRKENLEGK